MQSKFVNRLTEQASENPMLFLGVGAATITAIAKLIDAGSAVQGRRAYAKQVKNSAKKSKKK